MSPMRSSKGKAPDDGDNNDNDNVDKGKGKAAPYSRPKKTRVRFCFNLVFCITEIIIVVKTER